MLYHLIYYKLESTRSLFSLVPRSSFACIQLDLRPSAFRCLVGFLKLHPPLTACWQQFETPLGIVLGSPVRSGFSSIFDKTETETGLPFLKFSKTETETVIDRSTAVLCGLLRLQDRSEPVTVQTSLQPVPDRSYTWCR